MGLKEKKTPQTYDFSAAQLTENQKQTLIDIHKSFSKEIEVSLTDFCSLDISIGFLSLEKTIFSRYALTLLNPTCLSIMDMKPLPHHGILEINTPIAYAITDKMLGGSGEISTFSYDMSNLEMAINRKYINLILKQLSATWQAKLGLDIDFDLHQLCSKPASCDLLFSHKNCIVIRFNVQIAKILGLMTIAIPLDSLHSIFDPLESSSSFASSKASLIPDLSHLDIELTAKLGDVELLKSDLHSLQIGDILSLSQKANSPIEVMINGECCFLGNPCLKGTNKGIVIQKIPKGVA